MNRIDPRQELMTHVEQIVRPIAATQSTKLRMRRELLAHLDAAYREELARDPDRAIDLAKARLGEPAEITRQLQRSVSLPERLLLSSLTPARFNRFEKRVSQRWSGIPPQMTMGHASIIVAVAMIMSYVFGILAALRVPMEVYRNTFAGLLPSGLLLTSPLCAILCMVTFAVAAGLIVAFASAPSSSRSWRAIRYGGSIVILQLALMITFITFFGRRNITLADIAYGLIVTGVFLLILIGTGRLISVLRRPYDEWLMIDVAE